VGSRMVRIPVYDAGAAGSIPRFTFQRPDDSRNPFAWIIAPAGSKLRPTQDRGPDLRLILELFLPGERFGLAADEAYQIAQDGTEGLSLG
jgi:hypothetical protein